MCSSDLEDANPPQRGQGTKKFRDSAKYKIRKAGKQERRPRSRRREEADAFEIASLRLVTSAATFGLSPPEQIHLRSGRERPEFFAFGAVARGLSDFALRREFRFLEVRENFLRAFEDGLRHAREPRDVDAVTFIRSARDDLAEEKDRKSTRLNSSH